MAGDCAEVTVEGHRAETADDLARRAGCSSPVAILFGGVTGRFCQLNGRAWDGGGGSTVFNGYFANVKGQSWTVLVADGVPRAELFTFRDSFSFEG